MQRRVLSVWAGLLLLVFGWYHPAMAELSQSQLLKVGLTQDQTELNIVLTEGAMVLDLAANKPQTLLVTGDHLIFTYTKETIFINNTPIGAGPVAVIPGTALLTWNGRSYRGEFLISPQNGKLNLVNRIALEDYLRGVLPREVSPSWPMASLKAQAIAARTYSIVSSNRHGKNNYDLCATTHCQVYGGAGVENPNTDQAVAETAGLIIIYNKRPIYAYYHDSSGGYTEDPVNVWSTAVPYLKPVPDWDFNAPLAQWTRTISWQDLQVAATRNYPQVGRLYQVLPVGFGRNGKVLKLNLRGDKGEVIISGEQFRYLTGIPSSNMQLAMIYGPEPFITLWWVHGNPLPEVLTANNEIPGLGADILNPPWDLPDPWSWLQDKEPIRVVVKGAGWGHGLGLSQEGAKEMAVRGYTELQILEHYYPGATVAQWN